LNQSLIDYTLHLADNALIIAQRNSEWCGHGPVLEQDIAITNISLDLIGQARSLYQYAAELINSSNISTGISSPSGGGAQTTEDTLAYLRDARAFKNCLLTEQPNGDWAQTILRQFFFSTYQYLLYQQLQQSTDATLAAIAEKSLKEVTYHVRWSSEWVIRLGDGTEESHDRMLNAFDELWMYTGEMFIPATYESDVAREGTGVDVTALKDQWHQRVEEIFAEATLPSPSADAWSQTGGKEGVHTEHLGFILAEMQFMQRAYPNSEW
jgi:ring-1,2-phenylacetyl-CoA epoxidase subunit PaaC